MKKEKIETGRIVGTHGVRGGLRVQPWCDSPDFLCGFRTLFFKTPDGFQPVRVRSARPHGNIVIMELSDVTTMEQAEALRSKVLYLDRKELSLAEDQYLICDLIGCEVYDADSNGLLGKVSDVSETGANDVWHIMQGEKEYLIPAIDEVVISVDVEKSRVVIRPLAGIFEE